MSLYENSITLTQLMGLDPITKTSQHQDSRHGSARMMVFTGPELADAKDRAIQVSVEQLPHQFYIGVREIAGISDLFIEQPLGGVIIFERWLHPARQRRDAVTAFTHQGQ
jgi:hypothetical protein